MANFLKTKKTVSVLMILGSILLLLLFFNYKINPVHFLADLEGSLVDIITPPTDTIAPPVEETIVPPAETTTPPADVTTPPVDTTIPLVETTPPVEETIVPPVPLPPPPPQPKVEEIIPPIQNPPVITKVVSPILHGSFKSGVIPIMVLFNKAVSVSGTPQLILATGNPETTAVDYKFGSKKSLLFLYHIAPGNYSSDLDYSSSSSLILNGGQIQDSSGNPANLTLPEPGSAGSLSNYSNIVIDAAQ
ncbi:MAG: fibronectin type III domain-containing protein [Parcubacteria group bacterium Licking1014_1]|nr:MAG: fibronectin type III domain-containing protein [Parcubacteria group bacterium Licking1014_1]